MRGSLGEKLFEGASADIHAWAPGQVVKLFKPGFLQFLGEYEARMTRAVFAAGAPAPDVLGEVTLEGRFGIVLSHFEGPTLLQLSRSGAVTTQQAGAILASLALSVHRMAPPQKLFSLHGWMAAALKASGSAVPEHIGSGILALIDRLPPGHGLCHGDLHPGNVIVTADGPRLIDWTCSIRAPAAFDLAWSHILLTELFAELFDDPQPPLAVDAAARSEYARLAGLSPAALTAAMDLCMPIVLVRLFIMLGGPTSSRWQQLMQRVEAALRAED